MRHKHADLIHAWAEGAEIEGKDSISGRWENLSCCDCITWSPHYEYRIKPQKKPDVVIDAEVIKSSDTAMVWGYDRNNNIRCTFDGETGKLIKAEVLE